MGSWFGLGRNRKKHTRGVGLGVKWALPKDGHVTYDVGAGDTDLVRPTQDL